MEKLQKALQKAREQREPATAGQATAPALDSAAKTVSPAGDTDTLWQALKPFSPSQKTLEKNRIITASSNSLGSYFDILRTKIVLTMRKNGWTRLAITSPTMGCGKTMTACNLAIGCARNPDQRTALIELDLRRPSIAKTLQMPPMPDVTEMLSGKTNFSDQALLYSKNVAISAANKASEDPTSLLTSKAIQNSLQEIETLYEPDLLIFDLPPLLVSDDTTIVLRDVDCALLVARAGATTVSQIDTCEREIAEHTNMIGIVLNQCRNMDEDYSYYE